MSKLIKFGVAALTGYLIYTKSWKTLLILAPLIALGIIIRAKKLKNKPKPVEQKERKTFPKLKPGNGTPLFHGVRVVEIGNTIAIPVIGRLFADFGAEVFKVEPTKGDYWRRFILEYEKPRTHGSSFEAANLGKSSICIDLTTEEGQEQLDKLLKGADVLLCNTKIGDLAKHKLTQEDIMSRHPQLVYCSLSAWGHDGEERELPGYDLGAFWGATGMAASVQKQGDYNAYPVGMGDLATSLSLLGAVSSMLRRRVLHGVGGAVTGALLRSGAFCMLPLLLEGDDDDQPDHADDQDFLNGVPLKIENEVPKYAVATRDALCSAYIDSNGEAFALLVPLFDEKAHKTAQSALSKEFGKTDFDSLFETFSSLSYTEIARRLSAINVPFEKSMSVQELCKLTDIQHDPRFKAAEVFTPNIPDAADVPLWVRAPFQCDCSKLHEPTRAAPRIGEQTNSIINNGWSPRSAEASLPINDKTNVDAPLDGVVVVEAGGLRASICCMLLASCGATVVRVEFDDAETFQKGKLGRNLLRGKQIVRDDIHAHLASAHVFVCDFEEHKLPDASLQTETLRKTYPNLIVVRSTQFGLIAPKEEQAQHKDSVGAFWMVSGLQTLVSGSPVSKSFPPLMPSTLFGSFVGGINLFAGASAALFHQARTNESQLVTSNQLRDGLWLQAVFQLVVVARDLKKVRLFLVDPSIRKDVFLVPTAHCVQTKDGVWIQLLGAELPRHAKRTFQALGLWPSIIGPALYSVVFDVIANRKEKQLVFKVAPLMKKLNLAIRKAVKSKTYDELVTSFDKYDVWYTKIRMPRQFRAYKQAHVNNAFSRASDGAFLVSPPFDLDFKTPLSNASVIKK